MKKPNLWRLCMKNRDIVILVIVLLGMGWLFYDNYQRNSAPQKAPAKIEQLKPITK